MEAAAIEYFDLPEIIPKMPSKLRKRTRSVNNTERYRENMFSDETQRECLLKLLSYTQFVNNTLDKCCERIRTSCESLQNVAEQSLEIMKKRVE